MSDLFKNHFVCFPMRCLILSAMRSCRHSLYFLCVLIMDSTFPLLSKYKISSLFLSSKALQPGLCQTWLEIPMIGFPMLQSISSSYISPHHENMPMQYTEIFSPPELKAHMLAYSMLRRRPSSTISKIFSSETTWPIKVKLHLEHP